MQFTPGKQGIPPYSQACSVEPQPSAQLQKLSHCGRIHLAHWHRHRPLPQAALTKEALLWAVPMVMFWHGLWQVLDALAAHSNPAVFGSTAMVAVFVASALVSRRRDKR